MPSSFHSCSTPRSFCYFIPTVVFIVPFHQTDVVRMIHCEPLPLLANDGPPFEKACSNVALRYLCIQSTPRQIRNFKGHSSCLLHQANTVIAIWSSYFFATSFCRLSQVWAVISHSVFSELALCWLLAFPPFLWCKVVVPRFQFASTPVPSSVCSTSFSEGGPTNPLFFL